MIAETRSGEPVSSAQSGASLGAACTNYCAATRSGHAGTKSVGTFSFNLAGLKCTFHFLIHLGCLTPERGRNILVFRRFCQPNPAKKQAVFNTLRLWISFPGMDRLVPPFFFTRMN